MIFILFLSQLVMADYEFSQVSEWRKKSFLAHAEAVRYVTHYNKKLEVETIEGMPWVLEDCHDESDRFFNWNKSVTFSVQYSGGIKFDLLGFETSLGKEIGQETQVGFERWIQAVKGIKAKHELLKHFETWEGITYKQKRLDNGDIKTLKTKPFKLKYVNPGLVVKRTILEVCEDLIGE